MSKLVTQEAIKVQLTANAQKQLKAHALQILKRQEDLIKQKLQREQEKLGKVKQIQNNFVKWVEKKTLDNNLKLQKVQKNKTEQIEKIVKRCKDRDKYLNKKKQQFKVKKKKNLNLAWKKAEKFNEDIQNYYKSKNFMSRSGKISHSGALSLHDQAHRELLNNETNQKQMQKDNMKSFNNKSNNSLIKPYSSLNNNSNVFAVKDNIINMNKTHGNQRRFNRIQSSSTQYHPKQKTIQILQKHKQIDKRKQDQMLQQLGKKLQKIQQTRIRRQKIYKKQSKEDMNESRDRNFSNLNTEKNLSKKKDNKKLLGDRIHSQQSYKRQTRIKDRTHDARMKRQQMFQQHIVQGYEYLQSIKLRHLKTVISKNIQYNAIEKKLYIQRLNN